MVIHSSSLWDLCEKQFSVVVCIYKNKMLVELGLVEHFDFVVVSKVASQDLVGWNNLQVFCLFVQDYGYAAVTTTENL